MSMSFKVSLMAHQFHLQGLSRKCDLSRFDKSFQNHDVLEFNSEYGVWDTKDRIVVRWIYCSVAQNYLKYLIRNDKDSSDVYWKALEKVFSHNSSAQLLRWELQSSKK